MRRSGAGAALLLIPSRVVLILLGTPLDAPAALTLGRVGGAGLLSLGVACWLARDDGQSRAAGALVSAMTVYNICTVAILTWAGAGRGLVGVALWLAVVLHARMAGWCIARILRTPVRQN